MTKLNDFFNDGFGWICRHCDRELKSGSRTEALYSRLMSEGEAEGKQPRLSNLAMAKWADPARRTLMCPKCGITELLDLS
jgi:hypothetical protein